MSDSRYHLSDRSVFSLHFHFAWCPKYRRSVLTGPVARELQKLLQQKADTLQVTIESLEIMPDHVHLSLAADPTEAPQHLANQFKRFTSRILREKYPHLRSRLPSLWSRSYYVGSIGRVSKATITRFIEDQTGK